MNRTSYATPAARLAALEAELAALDPNLPPFRRADLVLAVEVARANAARSPR